MEDDRVSADCLVHGLPCHDQGNPVFWEGKHDLKLLIFFFFKGRQKIPVENKREEETDGTKQEEISTCYDSCTVENGE